MGGGKSMAPGGPQGPNNAQKPQKKLAGQNLFIIAF
jgi:hypothetical protein